MIGPYVLLCGDLAAIEVFSRIRVKQDILNEEQYGQIMWVEVEK